MLVHVNTNFDSTLTRASYLLRPISSSSLKQMEHVDLIINDDSVRDWTEASKLVPTKTEEYIENFGRNT